MKVECELSASLSDVSSWGGSIRIRVTFSERICRLITLYTVSKPLLSLTLQESNTVQKIEHRFGRAFTVTKQNY